MLIEAVPEVKALFCHRIQESGRMRFAGEENDVELDSRVLSVA